MERLDDGSYGMLFPVLWHLVGFDVDFVLHPLFAPGAIALILPDQKGMLLFFLQLPVLLHEPSHLFDNFPFSFQEHRLVNCWLINLIVQGQVVEVQQNLFPKLGNIFSFAKGAENGTGKVVGHGLANLKVDL